jgi:hypothetical protein
MLKEEGTGKMQKLSLIKITQPTTSLVKQMGLRPHLIELLPPSVFLLP